MSRAANTIDSDDIFIDSLDRPISTATFGFEKKLTQLKIKMGIFGSKAIDKGIVLESLKPIFEGLSPTLGTFG